MKKITSICLFSFIGLFVASSISVGIANATFLKTGENLSIGIATDKPTTKYYLKGSFNEWKVDENYLFTDVTSLITPEANQIAEYKLTDVALKKGEVLKAWSSDDKWYGNFTHNWSGTPISYDGDGNYKVLISGEKYEFTLKLYNDNSSKLEIFNKKDTLFFKPNEATWQKDGAWFAVRLYTYTDTFLAWQKLENPRDDGYYKISFPKEAAKIKFYRMDKDKTELDESNAWNNSGLCLITNNDPNNAFYQWSDQAWNNGWDFTWSNVGSWSTL